MSKTKLTLYISKDLIKKAKMKALEIEKSLSQIVETLLEAFTKN